MTRIKSKQKGFTIIELMIATTVFSVVLLVCLGALVYIGRLYYKGVTTTQTQSAARDVVESIGDSVRFAQDRVSVSELIDSPYAASNADSWDGFVCIGSRKYSYRLGDVLVTDSPATNLNQANQVLVESIDPECSVGTPTADIVTDTDLLQRFPPREILGEYMRLNKFEIIESDVTTGGFGGALVTINISIAYGGDGSDSDAELFNYVSGSSGEIQSCKTGVAGAQFCAVTNLSKTVREVVQ